MKKAKPVPKLGDLVKDRISECEGVVVGYTKWLAGCDRVVIQPRGLDKDGRKHMTESFDVTEVDVITPGLFPPHVAETESAAAPGGPRPTPTRW